MSNGTYIEIHTGLGSGEKVIWKGHALCVPREGETIQIKKAVYRVDWVRHHLGGLGTTKVEIYVRA